MDEAGLLDALAAFFGEARAAYRDYLRDGRAFRHAAELRRVNEQARALLVERAHLLPEALRADAAALVAHYDAWTALWDAHARAARPGPSDPFAFANSHRYPAEAEARLMARRAAVSGG